jgi:hypothetical protein
MEAYRAYLHLTRSLLWTFERRGLFCLQIPVVGMQNVVACLQFAREDAACLANCFIGWKLSMQEVAQLWIVCFIFRGLYFAFYWLFWRNYGSVLYRTSCLIPCRLCVNAYEVWWMFVFLSRSSRGFVGCQAVAAADDQTINFWALTPYRIVDRQAWERRTASIFRVMEWFGERSRSVLRASWLFLVTCLYNGPTSPDHFIVSHNSFHPEDGNSTSV